MLLKYRMPLTSINNSAVSCLQDEDPLVRGLSVLSNLANQLYYPCEHVAWAADAGVVRVGSQKWWALSTGLWASALLLGILR